MLENRSEFLEEDARLRRRLQDGLRDDLQQGNARPIVVDEGVGGGVDRPQVNQLSRVLLQLEPCNPNPPRGVVDLNRHAAAAGDGDAPRLVVLGNLKVLGHVGIIVVLPEEIRLLRHLGAEGQAYYNGVFNRLPIHCGEGAGDAKAHGADVGVGRILSIVSRATAKQLRLQIRELAVNLEAD
jgi:hypothetical protein